MRRVITALLDALWTRQMALAGRDTTVPRNKLSRHDARLLSAQTAWHREVLDVHRVFARLVACPATAALRGHGQGRGAPAAQARTHCGRAAQARCAATQRRYAGRWSGKCRAEPETRQPGEADEARNGFGRGVIWHWLLPQKQNEKAAVDGTKFTTQS